MRKIFLAVLICVQAFAAEQKEQVVSEVDQELLKAVKEENVESVVDAIKRGANVDVRDDRENYYWSPLHFAAKNGNEQVAKLLIEAKAQIDKDSNGRGSTPLHMAIVCQKDKIVKILVDNQVVVNARDYTGTTMLSLALAQCYLPSLQILLDAKADPNSPNVWHNNVFERPIRQAINLHDDTEFLKLLIKYKANIDSEVMSKTFLYDACNSLKELLKAGLDLNQPIEGGSVVQYAIRRTAPRILAYLLCNGFELLEEDIDRFKRRLNWPNLDDSFVVNFSTLMWSSYFENLEKIEELALSENLSETVDGKTALMLAHENEKSRSVASLQAKIELIIHQITDMWNVHKLSVPLVRLIGHYLYGTHVLSHE